MKSNLYFQKISKTFPGVKALDSVTFEIKKGTVHGLVGENGAGKSTLLKILSGNYIPDDGYLSIEGEEVSFSSPFDAIATGVSIIHQELQLVSNQTVAENITLGRYASKYGFVRWNKMFDDVDTFLKKHNIDINPRLKISDISIGQQQMVEIAKALYYDANIIAFDEPTSSLSEYETTILFDIIRQLRESGKIVIYVSHKLKEIFDLCDVCTILKDGQHVFTKDIKKESLTREQLITGMTGKSMQDVYGYRSRSYGSVILETKQLKGKGVNEPVDITVQKGEIVGLFGLIGAGRSELARLIYGVEEREGAVFIDGSTLSTKTPKKSIAKGVMFCSEDRKKDGIVNGRPIWENINISARRHFSYLKVFLNKAIEFSSAEEQKKSLNIKTPNLLENINNLSGGNQQKVILGRWLSEKGMKVLIVDEPTRGIDVGAKFEIYNILYTLAEKGIGIIVISSELPEIMGVCDRLYVMREGKISCELDRKDFKEEIILEYSFPQGGE